MTRSDALLNGLREIQARYDEHCGHCHSPIEKGETCFYGRQNNNPRAQIFHHGLCPTPNIALGTSPANPVGYQPADGTYTVVREVEGFGSDYVTISLETMPPTSHFAPGERVVSMLIGPNNERDFRGIGFVTPSGTVRFWRRNTSNWSPETKARYQTAVLYLYYDPEQAATAGETYAMLSSRCCRCGRKLTVPASLHRGMGSICAQRGEAVDPE